MTASFTLRFRKQYQKLSKERQARFDKQLAFLLSNLRHPSLRAKKYVKQTISGKRVWMPTTGFTFRSKTTRTCSYRSSLIPSNQIAVFRHPHGLYLAFP